MIPIESLFDQQAKKQTIFIIGRTEFMLSLLCCFAILLVNPLSVPLYIIFAIAAHLTRPIFIQYAFQGKNTVLLSFAVYTLLALLIFTAQMYTLPNYEGLSGPEGGIGTDDTYFYTQATKDVDFSRNGALRAYSSVMHPFSIFLGTFVQMIEFFRECHLVDLLLLNVFALSFIPSLCSLVAVRCLPLWYESPLGPNSIQLAYWLALMHFSLWADGLILIRDGWTALFFTVALFSLINGSIFKFLIATICLAYFRIASAIMLVCSVMPLLLPISIKKLKKYAFLILLPLSAIVVIVIAYAVSSGYVDEKQISFLRNDYVNSFIANAADKKQDSSILFILSSMSFYLRIPLTFVFFFCAPYTSLNIVTDGVFVPRLLLNFFAGVLNIVLLKWWVQSLVVAFQIWLKKRTDLLLYLHLTYLIGIFLVSTMSLQLRHKTMLLPLLCVLAAHGFAIREFRVRTIGNIVMLLVFLVNIFNVVRSF
ncbi:hypothetical protein [Desulforhopalus sp. IMCC35007]|uniref:hypothetical protein n=1 Tax=Desulforhopalus sp. IMCC35007 TaxID=2569543 RepID=UPI0010AE7B75|nr:hypothetical protein [Desulforhopalus sp. IMCC35007]TKB09916.1 hypothetical protein FCL48_08080 [Desulforhopalus sp. IMCC35007]